MPAPNSTLLEVVEDYNNFEKTSDYWEFGYEDGSAWKKLGFVTAHHAELLQELKPKLEKYLLFDTEQKPSRIRLHADHLKTPAAFVQGIRNIRDILCPKESQHGGKFPQAVRADENEMWPLSLTFINRLPMSTGFVCGLSPVFGIVTTGVHLNIYKRDINDEDDPKKFCIFVARRSNQKSTFPGKYDQCAAGGYQYAGGGFGKAKDTSAKECLKREVKEEINGITDLLKDVKQASPIQFAVLRDKKWGEDFLGAPELGVKIPFDLEVKEDPIFKPNPNEVKSVEKKSVREIVEDLLNDEFKPNSALVMIDFLIRHRCLENISTGNVLDQMKEKLRKHADVDVLPHWNHWK
ncbi:thiamine pyrophosphokinase [Colletotrichum fioriniae PJ7]|uniref:Thiamine pyrophosphokinase n=1 Tax=Colletotrichum fioriniae PJ7 TaxID=1445577 RepID=A0A010SJF2_9PEZI|nr:thiamine pyrophosphokinase [Colletotrichum fioriniae PJ7]